MSIRRVQLDMGKIIGYARVANSESDIEVQKAALRAAGCTQIFEDVGSGKLPGIKAALALLSPGDTLVIINLSRLSRSSTRRLKFIEKLRTRGIFIRSTEEGIDTTQDANPIAFRIDQLLEEMYPPILTR